MCRSVAYHGGMSSSPTLPYSPTVRRRRLSAELIALRKEYGASPEQIAKMLERDRYWLARIENGDRKRPHVAEIEQLLDIYGVTAQSDPARREAILELVRQSRTKGWWSKYDDVLDGFVGLEAEASFFTTYQPMVVPGLLQTPAYAAATARAGINTTADVDRIVAARMERQRILYRAERPPRLWAVLDEAVLARAAGSEVMREQIAHLITVSELRTVTIQVLPFDAGWHAGLSGPFVILDFPTPSDPSVVYLESRHDSLYLEEPEVLDEYRTIAGHVQASALTAAESVAYLRRMIDEEG